MASASGSDAAAETRPVKRRRHHHDEPVPQEMPLRLNEHHAGQTYPLHTRLSGDASQDGTEAGLWAAMSSPSLSPWSFEPRQHHGSIVNRLSSSPQPAYGLATHTTLATSHAATSYTLSPSSQLAADFGNGESPFNGDPDHDALVQQVFENAGLSYDQWPLNLPIFPTEDDWVRLNTSVTAKGGAIVEGEGEEKGEDDEEDDEDDEDEDDEALRLTQSPASLPTGHVSPWFWPQSPARNTVNSAGGQPAKHLLPAPGIDKNSSKPLQALKPARFVQHSVTWVAEDPANRRVSSDRALTGDIGRPPGRRQGPLEDTVRRKAKEVRRVRACIPCARNNSGCSVGDICDRCRDASLTRRILCFRFQLTAIAEAFSPRLIIERFSKKAVEATIRQFTKGFKADKSVLKISSGPDYPPMIVTAQEFSPAEEFLVAVEYVPKDPVEPGHHAFVKSYALPLGLCGDPQDIRRECFTHLAATIAMRRNEEEATKSDTSQLSYKLFEAVNDYRKSHGEKDEPPLIRKACLLHAALYYMNRIVLLTPESADEVISSMTRAPTLPYKREVLTCKLINLQIKTVMLDIVQELVAEILAGLQEALNLDKGSLKVKKNMSNEQKLAWLNSLCTVLVLCICTEAIQVLNDAHAVGELRKNKHLYKSRKELYKETEVMVYRHVVGHFENFYRNAKFNPFLSEGLRMDDRDKRVPSDRIAKMKKFVGVTKGLMQEYRQCMQQKAPEPEFHELPDILTGHMAFRRRNSGRYIALFLWEYLVGKV